MAMIKCPECGNQISSRATSCVKCGLSMSEIFICPECSVVSLRNGDACNNCGCPIDTRSSDTVSNTIHSDKKIEVKNKVSDEELDKEYMRLAEKAISKVLARHNFTISGFYSDSGLPLSDIRKVDAARVSFCIPNEEKVFFIVSCNIMGGLNESSKGFAITSHGIYFKDDKRKSGIIYMHMLEDLKITTSMSFLRIGSYEFNVGTPSKLKNMMLDLQAEVINEMYS